MRIGDRKTIVTVLLALAVAALARDLTIPLVILSLFGLFDRFIGERVLQERFRQ